MNKEHAEYRNIRRGGCIRTELAKELCDKCGMDWNEPVSVASFEEIEQILKCNLFLINAASIPVLKTTVKLFHSLMYKSEYVFGFKQCWLLLNEHHYDVITNPKGFLACDYFCEKCCSCFHHGDAYANHDCQSNAHEHLKELGKCETGPMHKDAGHFLKRAICKGSADEIAFKIDKCKNKSAEMQDQITEEINNPTYIVYDFETDTHTCIHKPNLCEVTVLKASDDHSFDKSIQEKRSFEGYGCADDFCNWLFSGEHQEATVFAHNQSGYDAKFLLQWCINHDMLPDTYIQQGSGITYMYFRKFKLRFVDTYKFFLSPLADRSKTYGIDTVKGYCPHHFNLPENQNYVGRYPSIEYYGPKNMSPDKVAEFNKWYSGVKNDVFDFKNEFKKYCLADVELLAKAILK